MMENLHTFRIGIAYGSKVKKRKKNITYEQGAIKMLLNVCTV